MHIKSAAAVRGKFLFALTTTNVKFIQWQYQQKGIWPDAILSGILCLLSASSDT
jgi:hypothetical protein